MRIIWTFDNIMHINDIIIWFSPQVVSITTKKKSKITMEYRDENNLNLWTLDNIMHVNNVYIWFYQ